MKEEENMIGIEEALQLPTSKIVENNKLYGNSGLT